ncbi:MAG: UbiX family flavin prenyltransferase [Bacteroidota bacterium]
MNKSKRNILVAISGASGSIYAKILLEKIETLKDQIENISVVFSENAKKIWQSEIGDESYNKYPCTFYENNDFSAPFASGSSKYKTMIICPASMGIVGRIANGYSNDLISRAADVMLKENRQLILVPRETPFSLIHIENMRKIILAGGQICPANPSFYNHPKNINELVTTVIDRVLDLAGFQIETFRWGNDL